METYLRPKIEHRFGCKARLVQIVPVKKDYPEAVVEAMVFVYKLIDNYSPDLVFAFSHKHEKEIASYFFAKKGQIQTPADAVEEFWKVTRPLSQ